MSSQSRDLHRALLRPFIIHTLRAVGFHGTKPSVLDTLVNLAERHLLLLADTTAKLALNSHNDHIPTLNDVRQAMAECGVLVPLNTSAEETWDETLRRPREEEDVEDVRQFLRWFDGAQHAEIKRVAGMVPEAGAGAVGVGGGVVKEEDFLERLKKRGYKGGTIGGNEDARLVGTVLGREAESKGVVVEGGPVQDLREWRPKAQDVSVPKASEDMDGGTDTTIT
ncbi:hypothetical protein BDY17DRAFT_284329 [Neohortaea acidophila]|uniref:Bromodomain associated domain-containing protein n=1 Tax=Neohortaea acidophila TaxID=245834 RepID=A0A6A6PKN0_9PEZI|nr:uncharacterized protein BDY17DRAFT_284329 [Neohortaea acidophila]KAF2480475.1 hypothetical protein BDY17DRAFT_284329 [Neohortaea acidophila]